VVKHVVMWRLKPSAHGLGRAELAQRVKAMLEGLRGRIAGLLHLEVGIDSSGTEASADVVLYSEFVDQAALDAYQAHPEHQAAGQFIAEARLERRVVDYVAERAPVAPVEGPKARSRGGGPQGSIDTEGGSA
jgi:quinol monooxygenase YgiN